MGLKLVSSRRGQDGATLVEFAIILPLLLLLLFAIMEFGRLGFFYAEVWTAAREGARHATTIGDGDGDGLPNFVDCDDIESRALAKVTMQGISAADITVDYYSPTATPSIDMPIASCQSGAGPTGTGNIDPGTQIVVEVTREYDAIVPLIGGFVDEVPLGSTQSRSIHYGASE